MHLQEFVQREMLGIFFLNYISFHCFILIMCMYHLTAAMVAESGLALAFDKKALPAQG